MFTDIVLLGRDVNEFELSDLAFARSELLKASESASKLDPEEETHARLCIVSAAIHLHCTENNVSYTMPCGEAVEAPPA